MKPLNIDNPGCNYTSSNCVIWQGKDIPCINLCKGDSVSDVVFKLATELCDVLDTLNVNTYDISCLNLSCAPTNFHDFLQILINTICGLNGQAPGVAPSIQPSVDTVPVAPCFYYTNSFGDQVTTMTINDYVTAIGNRLCNLETRVTVVEVTTAQHTDQLNALQSQVDSIPPVVEQTITPICSSASVATPVVEVVNNHEILLCQYQGALGTTAEIYASLLRQCAGLGNSPQLAAPGSNMNALTGWNNDVLNLAGTINNLWLSICDLRSAVASMQVTCCPTGCSGVSLTLYTSISGSNLTLFVSGTIPSSFVNCSTLGSLVTIVDGVGNSFVTHMDIVTFLNAAAGFTVVLPAYFNLVTDIQTTMVACVQDPTTGTTCQNVLIHLIEDPASCPVVTYTPDTTDIAYSFTSLTGTATYRVEVYTMANVLVTSDSQVLTGPAVGSGTLVTGSINSTFKVRLVIITDSTKTCPFTNVVLLPTTLLPLTLASTAAFSMVSGGDITNSVAASAYVGDVGTSNALGVITNIAGPDVLGTLYAPGDAAVVTANADITNMITQAGLLTTVPLAGGNNMTGDTITAGYWSGAAITLDPAGNVTFDAAGDPNAIFIIISSSSIAFGAAGTVTLINGATNEMIFWVAATTVTIGAGCVIKGTVIATGNIASGAGADINGRLLTLADIPSIDTNNLYNT